MKRNRVWMGAVTAALALTVLTTGVLAGWHHGRSGGGNGGTGVCANTACRYVDANDDGICDNRGTGACRYVDANGDGVCDNRGTGACRYADTNGDGVCDTCGNGACHYVDADGDGVCDNYGQYAGTGNGGGHHGGGCRGGGCHR